MKTLDKMTILVMDDSPIIRQSTRLLLEQIGFGRDNIKLVANANQAHSAFQSELFDLFIVDYNLGEGSTGLQLLERLGHAGLLRHDPIIFVVTAESSAAVVRSFSEFDPSGFIVKPLRGDIISQSVRQSMNDRRFAAHVQQQYQQGGAPMALKSLQQASSKKSYNLAITRLCQHISDSGQPLIAIKILEKFTAVNAHVKAHLLYAQLLLSQQQLDPAERILTALLTKNANSIPALDLRCRLELARNQYDSASKTLQGLQQLSPQILTRLYAQVLLGLGLCANTNQLQKIKEITLKASNSVWERPHKLAFLAWSAAQLPECASMSLETLWAEITRGRKAQRSDAAFMSFAAWFYAKQHNYSQAIQCLHSSNQDIFSNDKFELLFINLHTQQLLGMDHAIGDTLERLSLSVHDSKSPLLAQLKEQLLQQYQQWRPNADSIPVEQFAQASDIQLLQQWRINRFQPDLANELQHRFNNGSRATSPEQKQIKAEVELFIGLTQATKTRQDSNG
ncbi:response regulator [uncultured Ferrimonas sp.]|uniref:response regulator n=1 Tax=uncultured Ferrimonas sp. TaxID=432640 RepID=UPI002608252E|nr:response regulator [uncultured Ferrimonas sp.]